MNQDATRHRAHRLTRDERRALGTLAGALALDVGGLNVINPALPEIGAHFGMGSSALQWTMTAYSVTFAGFLLLSGRLADLLGRRRMFALGVAVFSGSGLVAALAPMAWLLIAARAAQGLGAAMSGPAALALLTEVFAPGRARDRALGVYGAVGAASASLGLVLGGVMTEWPGWRAVFTTPAVLGALLLVLTRRALPEGGGARRGSVDVPGAAQVTLGLLLAVFGVSRAGEAGWDDPVAAIALVLAVLALAAFIVRQRRAADPLLPPAFFRLASVRAASLTAFLQYAAAVGLLFLAPLYLQQLRGYSPTASALALLPMSCVVFTTSNFLTRHLLARFGQKPVLVAGLLLIAVGMARWAWLSPAGGYWSQMLPGVAVTGLGIGLVFPSMTAAALTGVPADQHGVAGALNVVAQQVGCSVGVVLLVSVSVAATPSSGPAGQLAGYHAAYLTAGLSCVAGALLVGFSRAWSER
ncbi:MFS transporter [Kitasatospora sp. NPDC005856]|uniref:MFS transporter n=1 Tax=Kitasatospora sp. NPDC005856 TaxID=3154566 RepID=UPI00340A7B6C